MLQLKAWLPGHRFTCTGSDPADLASMHPIHPAPPTWPTSNFPLPPTAAKGTHLELCRQAFRHTFSLDPNQVSDRGASFEWNGFWILIIPWYGKNEAFQLSPLCAYLNWTWAHRQAVKSPTSKPVEPRKKGPSYFPLNPGWLRGILTMVYYNALYSWVV